MRDNTYNHITTMNLILTMVWQFIQIVLSIQSN